MPEYRSLRQQDSICACTQLTRGESKGLTLRTMADIDRLRSEVIAAPCC